MTDKLTSNIFEIHSVEVYLNTNWFLLDEFTSMQRTTNACESFHSKFNFFFYTSHSNIHQFLNILKQCQTDTYIKITSNYNLISVKRRAKYLKKQKFIDKQINNLNNIIITPL